MLRAAAARYAAFFRLPDVARLLVMAIARADAARHGDARLLLHVRALTGSFAAAGAAVGAYLGGSAATAPFVGRWIDRRGPRGRADRHRRRVPARAACACWLAEPLRLSPSTLSARSRRSPARSAPPITVLTRTMWRYRFDDEPSAQDGLRARRRAGRDRVHAGPALIALLLAVGSPTVAFGAAFVFTALAVPTFLASPALRYWRHDPHAERHLLGPLTEPRLLVVYATTFLADVQPRPARDRLSGLRARRAPRTARRRADRDQLDRQRDRRPDLRRRRTSPWRPSGSCARVLAVIVVPLALHAVIASADGSRSSRSSRDCCIAPALTLVTLLVSSYAPPATPPRRSPGRRRASSAASAPATRSAACCSSASTPPSRSRARRRRAARGLLRAGAAACAHAGRRSGRGASCGRRIAVSTRGVPMTIPTTMRYVAIAQPGPPDVHAHRRRARCRSRAPAKC